MPDGLSLSRTTFTISSTHIKSLKNLSEPSKSFNLPVSFICFANLWIGQIGLRFWSKVIQAPESLIFSSALLLCFVGVFMATGGLFGVTVMLIFGVIGFFARRHGFSVAPIAVGLILGEMVETNLQHSLKMFDEQWWLILTQPLALMFLIFAFLGLCGPYLYSLITKHKD